jgi:hypothetical protein
VVADESLKLLREAGAESEGRRAFGDMLLDRSQTQSKSMVGETFVNPMSLQGRLNQYRSTVPTVLGESNAKNFSDLTGVGRLITRDELINPSGTARALEVLQAMGGAGAAVYGIADPKENESRLSPLAKYAALTVAAPYLGARAFNSPSLARSLTSAPKAVDISLARPELGIAGRLLANRNNLMPKRESKPESAPETLPADFFDGARETPDTLPADFFDRQQ